jgi:hypothetical protein
MQLRRCSRVTARTLYFRRKCQGFTVFRRKFQSNLQALRGMF